MNKRKIFTKVYEEHIDRIYRFIYLKVGSDDIAEDLTSDLFLNIWKKLVQNQNFIKDIKNIRTFLYRAAYNKVIDFYKQNKEEIFIADELNSLANAVSTDKNQATINYEFEEAKKLLDKLSPKYRDIIIFYYIEELSTKEIAKITGKSEVNIRVIISRGLKQLRQMNNNNN